ncbi:MAG: hypothetical protein HY894_08445 [Deltaproteobacteria bacterium]|nr:hypothetical protein [Deltaproteobacteria bacterium]
MRQSYALITCAIMAASVMFCGAAFAAHEPGPGKLVLDSKAASMSKAGVGPVVFPHDLHKQNLKCSECHPNIFKDQSKANDISMKKNMEGQFCGSPNCHNSPKAFPLYQCANCHTNVKGAK